MRIFNFDRKRLLWRKVLPTKIKYAKAAGKPAEANLKLHHMTLTVINATISLDV